MADVKKSSINKKSGCYLLNIKQPERTLKRIKLSFQRMSATITTLKSERTAEAAVGLVDLSESGAGFFTSELLPKGAGVEVTITEPLVMKLRAVVAWSIPIQSGLNASRFPCRSGLQFIFDNDLQRQAFQDYLEKITASPVESYKRAAASLPDTGIAPDAAAAVPPSGEAPPAASTVTSAAEVHSAPAAEAAPIPEATPVTPAPAPALAEAPPVAEASAPAESQAVKPEGGEGGGQSQAA